MSRNYFWLFYLYCWFHVKNAQTITYPRAMKKKNILFNRVLDNMVTNDFGKTRHRHKSLTT